MDGVLAWKAWVPCLRGWRASVGGVGAVLTWVRASVGGVLTWVTWLAC